MWQLLPVNKAEGSIFLRVLPVTILHSKYKSNYNLFDEKQIDKHNSTEDRNKNIKEVEFYKYVGS